MRTQNFFANYGHLLYLTFEGEVYRTMPENELGGVRRPDPILGRFSDFDPGADRFYKFRIKVDDHIMSMFIGRIGRNLKISDSKELPYLYASGKIFFQTYNARTGLGKHEIKQL